MVNKLERLLNVTAVLLDTARPLTAEQIRTKVNGYPPAGSAFHRAFERDKDDLRVLGIPLRVERVPATDPPTDGYRISPDDYYLPDPGLESDELAALHLAAMTVQMEGFGEKEALWKLGGLLNESQTDATIASLPTNAALVPLFEAVTSKSRVTFRYKDSERDIDPWRLDFQRGRWYVSGFDHNRQGERSFRLDRVEGAVEKVGDAHSEQRPDASETDRKAWEFGDSQVFEARLQVDAQVLEAVSRQLGDRATVISTEDDGSTVFSVPVSDTVAFRTFVLGYLANVEVLTPPELRQEIVDWLEQFEEGL